MRKEYPPMLTGQPENQLAQLRAYLVRLIGYIDEALRDVNAGGASEAQQAAQAEWQNSVNTAIGSLRTAVRSMPLVQTGSAGAGDLMFPRPYNGPPAVFVTAGSVSDVTESGCTLSAACQWLAAGDPARRS